MTNTTRTVRLGAGLVMAALALAACAPATSVAPLSPGDVPLPTPDFVQVPPNICAGVGINAVLHGDPHDPALTWIEGPMYPRSAVVWPVGYRARFTPKLEVLDASGAVVLREGDLITGQCGFKDGRTYLAPPFR